MSKLLQNIKDPSLIQIEIISIGDELLIGQTINTNASWMGEQLSLIGGNVVRCVVIQDDFDVMMQAFSEALERSDIILVTGGLGPTKDDITKTVLSELFDSEMVLHQDTLDQVTEFFESRNKVMLDVNREQAMIPQMAEVLYNAHGTAPGMWFEDSLGKILVSMPGVPYEMKYIMNEHVLPRLTADYKLKSLHYKTIQTQGIGESYIADRIIDLENEMRSSGVSLAYLPSPGGVRLRLSCEPTETLVASVDKYVESIVNQFPQYVFGMGQDKLESVLGQLLADKKLTVGTVESCTGGAIASTIASVPGASSYFEGSIVSYTADIKNKVVGVPGEIMEANGLVSEQVAAEMAINGKKKLNVDYCISVTGNAGPTTNENKEGVGVVWIAVAGNERVLTKRFMFENNRSRNIRRSVLTAMNLLRCELLKINMEKSS